MGTRDRSSLIGFVLFWLVLGTGCWLGILVAHSAGFGSSRAASVHAASTRHPHRQHVATQASASPTISSIFAKSSPSLRGYDPRKLRTLIATGDRSEERRVGK